MATRGFLRSLKTVNYLFRPVNLISQPKFSLPAAISNINSRSFSITQNALIQNVYSDLSSFLTQEIKIEKESRKKSLPEIVGFDLKTEGPNVTLSRTFKDEQINVKLNVNHSLDSPETGEEIVDEQSAKEKEADSQIKSRPAFTVDIKRGGQTLSFGCSFLPVDNAEKDVVEDFQIDEFAIHSGEWNENVYTADCSVLDGQLYDILLSLLEERGVGEEFANQLVDFSTSYEHLQYVNLLENLKNFAK